MERKLHFKYNSVINVLTAFMLCSITIFETYSWGRYVLLGCAALIFVMSILRDGGKARILIEFFPVVFVLFAFYALVSSLWAIVPSDATAKFKTLIELFFVIYILYISYRGNADGVSSLLSVIKWSSYVIVLYSIAFYGLDTLYLMVQAAERIANDYTNANTIGMLAAVGILIQVDELLSKREFKLSILLAIPSLFMITITQSRKALLIMLVGIVLDVFVRNIQSKDIVKVIFRLTIGIGLTVLALYALLSLPMFSGVVDRMDDMLKELLGSTADSSTRIRNEMIQVGLSRFLQSPFVGVGIGCPHHIALAEVGKDSYLHNNFVELLCGGGIIGFLLYYSMYIYLFSVYWKYRKQKNSVYIICLVIMLVIFIMDYGMVSYYNKIRYIYLLLFFVEAECLKRRARACATEVEVS